MNRTQGIVLISAMTLIVGMLATALLTPAFAGHCDRPETKRVATAELTEETGHRGNFAQNTPVSWGTLCGSSWSEGSYKHLAVSHSTSSVNEPYNYVEVMWYYGYNDLGDSSTEGPAYMYLKIVSGNRFVLDISDLTGKYPDYTDRINMTVRYDDSSGGNDYFKIIIKNVDQPTHWIEVENILVNGKGYRSVLQSETFNDNNGLKGKQYYASWMDDSSVWHNWDEFNTWEGPDVAWNQLCVDDAGVNYSFKFGTWVSGVCQLP